jgi:16S rRNA (adenine1518-N6/adenine1519-N6)-dimethyltransferase
MPSNFHPQKRFGQNFLIDKNILGKILQAISISADDTILEIGPGRGMLTKELTKAAKKVIAVELDKYLCNLLKSELKSLDNLQLFNEDILEFALRKTLRQARINKKIKIIGNIPYNITTPILEYIFENIDLWQGAYLMLQKELALRLMAKPGTKDYSSLSCFVNFYTEAKILFKVRRSCFRPQPKVDSCFVRLLPRLKNYWPVKDKAILFKVIRSAFSQRRKNILNALSLLVDKDKLIGILAKLNLDTNLRPENLSLTDYIRISNVFFDCNNSGHTVL